MRRPEANEKSLAPLVNAREARFLDMAHAADVKGPASQLDSDLVIGWRQAGDDFFDQRLVFANQPALELALLAAPENVERSAAEPAQARQNTAYAARYADKIRRVREAETVCLPGETGLTQAVARSLFKLMAYKDEYEVARLYTETDFLKRVADQFDGSYKLNFHLAPPLLADRDPTTGHLRKRSFGPWMLLSLIHISEPTRPY